ncbi:MAG: LPS translocon maturation chaperone LptM [Thermohalobaculum sp.]
MSIARIAMTALLAATLSLVLGLAACGIKGDPIRPGSEEDLKTKQSAD